MTWRVGADIGGTFTDLVLVDDTGACRAVAKLLTTPDDPGRALLDGIDRLTDVAGVDASLIGEVVHGTTLVANALIERSGARTALITTAGFRDVLEIGRESRYDLYDLDLQVPAPLVPSQWRHEVGERVHADGSVVTALDEQEVRKVAAELSVDGVESVAVAFLHSYRFPAHERAAGAVLRDAAPHLDVTLSCDVLPQMGEYARVSTAVANAYVRPLVHGYLDALQQRLQSRSPHVTLSLLASTGRVAPAGSAWRYPVRLVESGPAGGVLAAAAVGAAAACNDVLAFDMGGTTAKAAYVTGGRPRTTSAFEVARIRRFTRGSGLPIQVPSIELIEIGAGGGSIAHVDRLGLVHVGPASAGSTPGPACYGAGGSAPTVTDADLELGYLGADSFLGGTMRLDAAAADAALASLAPHLDGAESAEDVALAVRRVVDEQMAAAARMHAVEQGLDPGRFALVATGGAGPVHACSVARALGIGTVIVPARAGVASAHGFLTASHGFDVARSAPTTLRELDWDAVRGLLAELSDDAAAAAGGISGDRQVEADVRFVAQGDAVTVTVPETVVATGDSAAVETAMAQEYERRYGRIPDGVPAEVVTWRVAFSAPAPVTSALRRDAAAAAGGTRPVWFDEAGGFVATPVVSGDAAPAAGPLVIEERESTLVVPPGARVEQADGAMVVSL